MVFQCWEGLLQIFFGYNDTGKRESFKREVSSTANEVNFGFGFNDVVFSDRVLRLEISPATPITDPAYDDSDLGTDFKLKTLNICSLILAAKSPFFYKLFKNGMRESQQRDEVTLKIKASEETALMELVNFMYDKPLNATSEADLVDVLLCADKFEVTSCVTHCTEMLLSLPMSMESALFYLDLPSRVPVDEVVQPLLDAAKAYLADYYRNFSESPQEEALSLPLSAVEAVLGSDGLEVLSEDRIFDFILRWSRINYPKLEERREILIKCMAQFICFPYMSCSKLKEVLICPDFDYEQVSWRVFKALFSKIEVPYGQHPQLTGINNNQL